MKKITKDGIIHTIQIVPISVVMVNYDFKIIPMNYNFELEILTQPGVEPTIGQMSPLDWFLRIFESPIIVASENNTPEMIEFCSKLSYRTDDPVLFIEKLDTDYLLNSLFAIISQLLEDGCELISIKNAQ